MSFKYSSDTIFWVRVYSEKGKHVDSSVNIHFGIFTYTYNKLTFFDIPTLDKMIDTCI